MHTGIDSGLGCTAMVTVDNTGKILYKKSFGKITSKNFSDATTQHPVDRYDLYKGHFESYFRDNSITGTIVMEVPRGTFKGHSIKLAELMGIYISSLKGLGFSSSKVYLPEAGTIKFFITGYGAAEKEDIIEELKKRGYEPEHDHEADAIAMALMSATEQVGG